MPMASCKSVRKTRVPASSGQSKCNPATASATPNSSACSRSPSSTPQAASLPHAERENIDVAVATLKESVSGNDYKLIRKRIDELNQATMHLAEMLMNSAVSTALEGRKLAEV